MDRLTEKNIGWLILISGIGHYGFGYFFWADFKEANVYYLTLYFMMDTNSIALYILAKTVFLKVISSALIAVGAYFMYIELKGNPEQWKEINFWNLFFIMANTMMFTIFFERYKNKINGRNDRR